MGKNLFILAALMTVSFIPKPVQAQENKLVMAGYSAVLKSANIKADFRVVKLQAFLAQYDSPLTPYAQVFVDRADEYQIDWRLVPAITGVESTFGKQIPFNSYNAYGWNNGNYYFKSWEDSIEIVSKALREKYLDRGLDTPYKIGRVYAPPSPFWGGKVNHFINKIESFQMEDHLSSLTLTI